MAKKTVTKPKPQPTLPTLSEEELAEAYESGPTKEDSQERQVYYVGKTAVKEPEPEPEPEPQPAPLPKAEPVKSSMSKIDIVRELLAENPDLTAKTAVPLIQSRYGVQMNDSSFNNFKGIVRREQKGTGSTPKPVIARPSVRSSSVSSGSSTLETIRTLKTLLATHRPEELRELITELAE